MLFIIESNDNIFRDRIFNIQAHVAHAILLLNHPQVIISRFEDLIGSNGGGSDKAQQELILYLTNKLLIPMDTKKLEIICIDLWGNEKGPKRQTFREGRIGSWKTLFKEEHKTAFKKHMGDYLIQLGYETDKNW